MKQLLQQLAEIRDREGKLESFRVYEILEKEYNFENTGQIQEAIYAGYLDLFEPNYTPRQFVLREGYNDQWYKITEKGEELLKSEV